MPHIDLPEGFPGISGPMVYRPETARPLNELAQALLRGHDTLTAADCELIATYVSSLNDCHYCQSIHGAIAAYHLKGNEQLVLDVKQNYEAAAISEQDVFVDLGSGLITPEDIAASWQKIIGEPREP